VSSFGYLFNNEQMKKGVTHMSRLEVDVKSIQKIIRDRALRAQKILSNFEVQAEKTFENLKGRVLDLLNVPTKKDLERLNKKVETLTKKLKA
jgi:hypothetical protein